MELDCPAPTTNKNSEDEHQVIDPSLRVQSLLLTSFPWYTSLPMVPTSIYDKFGNAHYALGLADSVDHYDTFLKSQSIHNSSLKALLRVVNIDSMSALSSTAIANSLSAYWLLDVISSLEVTENMLLPPPLHNKMKVDFTKHEDANNIIAIIQYSKALGNKCPHVISDFEKKIWKELINVALGYQMIYDAASNLVGFIPNTFNNVEPEIRSWFMLETLDDKRNAAVHLSSLNIEDGSMPTDWPLASILTPNKIKLKQPVSLLQPNSPGDQNDNTNKDSIQRPLPDSTIIAPATNNDDHTDREDDSSNDHDKSIHDITIPRHTRHKPTNSSQTISTAPKHLPLIIGNTYVKVENIDLEDLMAPKYKPSEIYPLAEQMMSAPIFSTKISTFNINGELQEQIISSFNAQLLPLTNSPLL
ncbi:hypothetical protein BYT27DRAFT_7261085 [Phlegmacium glaucopus]|nr:hypothetical protein BYT27DRAFT_7261085 [Phlegmacium glaucopus]